MKIYFLFISLAFMTTFQCADQSTHPGALQIKVAILGSPSFPNVEWNEENLHKIKKIQGSGSQETKEKILISMLQKTTGAESKYLTRIILGNMRLGVADMTVLDALSICFTGDKTNKKPLSYILYGGEDYQLLFTFSPGAKIPPMKNIYVIGKIVSRSRGIRIIGENGKTRTLKFFGYSHF